MKLFLKKNWCALPEWGAGKQNKLRHKPRLPAAAPLDKEKICFKKL